MQVYGLWYGGYSYSPGDIDNHLEKFPSKRAAIDAFRDRYDSNGLRKVTFHYVDRGEDSCYVPNVTESSTLTLYYGDPRDAGEPYPDAEVRFGPRGGVVVEAL